MNDSFARLTPFVSFLFLAGCNSAEHANDLLSQPFTAHTVYAQNALNTPQNCYCYPTLAGNACYASPQPLIHAAYFSDPAPNANQNVTSTADDKKGDAKKAPPSEANKDIKNTKTAADKDLEDTDAADDDPDQG